jgi:hypothetical protein
MSMHTYEVRPRKDHRGVDLIFDALPFCWLWYGEPNAIRDALGMRKRSQPFTSRLIRVNDDRCNVIEAREHAGRFSERGNRIP